MKLLSDNEMRKWLNAFDFNKYPSSVYEELVFTDVDSEKKYVILGAWKTGCLRSSDRGDFHVDSKNITYRVTARWKSECPVGYDTWHYLDEHRGWFETGLPSCLPGVLPVVLRDLIKRSGFGFVWSIFAAHCHRPSVFPLYDQHVYRAYKAIQSKEQDLPDTSPSDWGEYIMYAAFLAAQMKASRLSQADCDRALWAYGKQLKIKENRVINGEVTKNQPQNHNAMNENNSEGCVHLVTLGGKFKGFWWEIDQDCSIHIYRDFDLRSKQITTSKIISRDVINDLLIYLSEFKEFTLANNVTKLANGTERKDGIGYFLFNNLGWSTTDCQLASHIGSIFSNADIWRSNGKKRNIKFESHSTENWCDSVTTLYNELQQIDED